MPRPGGPGAAAGALCQLAAPLTFLAPRPVLLPLNDTLGSHSSLSSPSPTAPNRTARLRSRRSGSHGPRCEQAGVSGTRPASAALTAQSTLFRGADSFKRRSLSNFNSSWAGNGFRLFLSIREDCARWMNWPRSVVFTKWLFGNFA